MIVLNLGAGLAPAPEGLVPEGGQEIRVDLFPPADIIADVRALPFPADYADRAYASHLLEHLPERDVVPTLSEWRRVLKPGATLFLQLPDVKAAAEKIAIDGIDCILYKAVNGALIRGTDLLYGWQQEINEGKEGMRHLCAFDSEKLMKAIVFAGFTKYQLVRVPEIFELYAKVEK